jgi:hypothetical protein
MTHLRKIHLNVIISFSIFQTAALRATFSYISSLPVWVTCLSHCNLLDFSTIPVGLPGDLCKLHSSSSSNTLNWIHEVNKKQTTVLVVLNVPAVGKNSSGRRNGSQIVLAMNTKFNCVMGFTTSHEITCFEVTAKLYGVATPTAEFRPFRWSGTFCGLSHFDLL